MSRGTLDASLTLRGSRLALSCAAVALLALTSLRRRLGWRRGAAEQDNLDALQ
jgi:hypothetical protein